MPCVRPDRRLGHPFLTRGRPKPVAAGGGWRCPCGSPRRGGVTPHHWPCFGFRAPNRSRGGVASGSDPDRFRRPGAYSGHSRTNCPFPWHREAYTPAGSRPTVRQYHAWTDASAIDHQPRQRGQIVRPERSGQHAIVHKHAPATKAAETSCPTAHSSRQRPIRAVAGPLPTPAREALRANLDLQGWHALTSPRVPAGPESQGQQLQRRDRSRRRQPSCLDTTLPAHSVGRRVDGAHCHAARIGSSSGGCRPAWAVDQPAPWGRRADPGPCAGPPRAGAVLRSLGHGGH